MPITPRPDLVSQLYRSSSACADHHDADILDVLHVETPVEAVVAARAEAQHVVFITGNPGDGKTHLLRRLEGQLKASKSAVVLDANERDESELITDIDQTLRKRRGLAIAINEGILIDLLERAAVKQWAQSARDQLLNPYSVRSRDNERRVTVLDLTFRNPLGPSILGAALAKIAHLSGPCARCSDATCPAAQNAAALKQDFVAQRLMLLMSLVGRSGFHATMRDVYGFLSFLVFGGRSCRPQNPIRPYFLNAFEGGVGPLFDAVRRFDPKNEPTPLLDERLWRRGDADEGWVLQSAQDRVARTDPEGRLEAFVEAKRRCVFEHRDGQTVVEQSGDTIDREMQRLTTLSQSSVTGIVRILNRFFDRDETRGGQSAPLGTPSV